MAPGTPLYAGRAPRTAGLGHGLVDLLENGFDGGMKNLALKGTCLWGAKIPLP